VETFRGDMVEAFKERERAGLPTAGAPEADRVRAMFDDIAPRYDRLNRLISFNQDRWWRRRAAHAATHGIQEPRVLDLCCGTGDLALDVRRKCADAHVVGADFSLRMLERAQRKSADLSAHLTWSAMDALALPFGTGSFDAVTMAFGFRNLVDRSLGLREIRRVLKPGGRVVILEAVPPGKGVFGRLFGFYLKRVLPSIGRMFSGNAGAYRYFADSVDRFPRPEELLRELAGAGFVAPAVRMLGFRGVVMLSGERPGASEP